MSKIAINSIDLLKITNQYRIFIDTCVWMYPPSKDFLTKALPEALFVRKATTKIPYRVIEEVIRKSKDPNKETRKRAKFASRMINLYIRAGLAEVLGDKEDPDVNDKTILYVFQKYNDRYLFCLFTRDRKLADDVFHLRDQKAVDNKECLIFGIKEDGSTYQWDFDKEPNQQPVLFHYKNKPSFSREPVFDRTLLTKYPLNVRNNIQVQLGDTIQTLRHGELTIGEELGAGEDGTVYRVKKGLVCKIFHKQRLSPNMYLKLMDMLSIPVHIQEVNWPTDLVFTKDKQFLGYVMKEAKGNSLQKALKTKSNLVKLFPEWNRQHLVELALSYLRAVGQLHDHGIILGSVDLDHVFVKNEKNISLTNTDGYQINTFRIDRSLVNFTPHEVLIKNEEELRTKEHDYYSVAVVLFAILFPGRMPYTFQGSNAKAEHVINKRFEFPFHPSFIPNYEKSPWALIWASLPFHLQQLFYETFVQNQRIPIEVWETGIRLYRDSLKNEELPTDLFIIEMDKITGKKVFAKCMACKSYLRISENEYKRITEINPNPLCERCYKLYTIKQPSKVEQSKPKEKKLYWTEKTSFLEAISTFRSELGSDK
ncbi:PIN domain-containing protein [Bacillus sp. AK128]